MERTKVLLGVVCKHFSVVCNNRVLRGFTLSKESVAVDDQWWLSLGIVIKLAPLVIVSGTLS